jgi:hypothetical protein
MTLQQVIALAQKQGLQARAVLDTRDAARWRDRAFNARLMPQLSLAGTLPDYQRAIMPVIQPTGRRCFVAHTDDVGPQHGVVAIAPITGVRSSSRPACSAWTSVATSIALLQLDARTVGLRQEIFRPNALKWDSREQDLVADTADRQYLEAREDVALSAANAFFDVHSARLALDNAVEKVAVNDTLFNLNKGRFEVGKIGENDLLQSELALLQARAQTDAAKLAFDQATAALKRLLSLPPDSPFEIMPPTEVPLTEVDTALAVQQALKNQSLVTSNELQSVQAKRALTEAKLNNGFGATVTATVGFNQQATVLDAAYRDLAQRQQYGVRVQMPIVQWGIERGRWKQPRRTRIAQRELRAPVGDAAAEEPTSPLCSSPSRPGTSPCQAKADTGRGQALRRGEEPLPRGQDSNRQSLHCPEVSGTVPSARTSMPCAGTGWRITDSDG